MKRMSLIFFAVLAPLLAGLTVQAGEYGRLAAGIARASGEQGFTRVAVAPFTAQNEAGRQKAALAGRQLAEALFGIPGLGVMDIAVLEKLKQRGARWAQVLVTGETFPSAGGMIVVVKTSEFGTGRVLARMQIEIKAEPAHPGDLRDAPGGAVSCHERLRDFQRAHPAEVDLRARYWAARVREPDFSYGSLTAMPGGELLDYDSMQKFYELFNAYYEGDAPVNLSIDETARLKELKDKEAAILRGCGGSRPV